MAEVMTDILSISGIAKRFGGFIAVDNVTMLISEKGIHSLIGPNGAGKSTLFDCITGILIPESGRVTFDGVDITRWSVHRRVHAGMARTFQITSLFLALSARENVALAVRSRAGVNFNVWRSASSLADVNQKTELILADVGIAHVADQLAGELSHGDQRALEVAVALALEPRVLFMDEPTAGMGREDVGHLSDVLRNLGKRMAILLVEHDMSIVLSLSERVTVLAEGKVIADGSPDEISKSPEVEAIYLGSGSFEV